MHRFHDPNESCKGRIRQLPRTWTPAARPARRFNTRLTLTGMYNVLEQLRLGFQNPGGAGTVQGEEEFLFNDNHAGKREGIHDRSRDGIQR